MVRTRARCAAPQPHAGAGTMQQRAFIASRILLQDCPKPRALAVLRHSCSTSGHRPEAGGSLSTRPGPTAALPAAAAWHITARCACQHQQQRATGCCEDLKSMPAARGWCLPACQRAQEGCLVPGGGGSAVATTTICSRQGKASSRAGNNAGQHLQGQRK